MPVSLPVEGGVNGGRGRRGGADELVQQLLPGAVGVIAESGVDRGGLDERAAWRGEPVEALRQVELPDRAGSGPGARDERDEVEVELDLARVEIGVEGGEALVVQLDAGSQEAPGTAEEDHACV